MTVEVTLVLISYIKSQGVAISYYSSNLDKYAEYTISGANSVPSFRTLISTIFLFFESFFTHLATDWITLEDVSLILVKNRSVPPLRISKNPP